MADDRFEVLSNVLFIGLGDFLSRGFAIITFVYLARVLGPDNLGLVAFGTSAAAIVAPIIDFGLGFAGTREVSRNPSALSLYVRTILFDRIILGGIVLVAFVGAALLLFHDPHKTRILLLYTFTLVPATLSLTWAFQALGKMKWFAFEKNTQAIIYLALILLLVGRVNDFENVPKAYAISAIVTAVGILVMFYHRYYRSDGKLDRVFSIRLLKSSVNLFVPTVLSQVSLPLGTLIVVSLSTLQQAGYYSAASKVILLSAIVPNLLWGSFYAVFARATTETSQLRLLGQVLYKYSIFIATVPLFFGIFYSREIVGILYGPSYVGATVALRLCCIVASVQIVSIAFTRILPAFGMDKRFNVLVSVGMAIQFVGSFLLVSNYGAAGGAFALIVAEAFMALRVLAIMRERLGLILWREPIKAISVMVISYAIVGGVRRVISFPVLPGLLAIVVLYVFLLFAFSQIATKDFLLPERTANRE